MRRKVCFVTGSRAEYGLLSNLMREIDSDQDLELQIIVTCMHLSPEFGLTYREIEDDGFRIDKKIEILLSSDSSTGVAKSMGMALMGMGEAYVDLRPDIIILLGDRFEILCAASAACVSLVPVAHIHGGEMTLGVVDEAFRHAITKMSHLHFTSTADYRRRVIQLGEDPQRVFNVGSIGVENIYKVKLLSKEALEKEIGFSLEGKTVLATFHPATLEPADIKGQFIELAAALDALDLRVIFTKANADPGGRIINRLIDDYVNRNPQRSICFVSMGQLRYLSALKHVDAVIGNSSSGIIEAPTLKTPTINIGDRQAGRVKAESIIDCIPKRDLIGAALQKALSVEFAEKTRGEKNPYEKANTASSIKEKIKTFELRNILKKPFYDLPGALHIQ